MVLTESQIEERKEVVRQRAAAWYAVNKDRALERGRKYRAENKDAVNQRIAKCYAENSEAYKKTRKRWAEKNRAKLNMLSVARSARNPEKRRAAKAKWYEKNRHRWSAYSSNRRARLKSAGGVLSKDIVNGLMSEQQGLCVYCKAELSQSGYHLDHKEPLSRGGANCDENMQLTCPNCNLRKAAKSHDDFMAQKGSGANIGLGGEA